MSSIKKLQRLIKRKPYLIWSTDNYDNLSEKSITENILNYGNWNGHFF